MPRFSQREGHVPVRSVIQTNDLDPETRLHIWNTVLRINRVISDRHYPTTQQRFIGEIWAVGLRAAIDEEPGDYHVWRAVKSVILDSPWYDTFDFLEEYADIVDREVPLDSDIRDVFNIVFESKLVAYRYIEGSLVAVDDQLSADAIQDALTESTSVAGARHHLVNAARLLSDRANPDYANSIKESISAVEAVIRDRTGESTLSSGLAQLRRIDQALHPALVSAWTKLYAWTSDASGIRHGSVEASDADQAMAKYMLVSCSAFVSYFIHKSQTSMVGELG